LPLETGERYLMYMHETAPARLRGWFCRRDDMRELVFAVLLAVPTVAAAQTAGDVAHLVWPLGAPAATGTAPANGVMFGGIDYGVARPLWLQRAPLGHGVAPATVDAGAFTAADLARLRDGNPGLAGTLKGVAPVLTATVEPGQR
jgi:hypothetical protein